MKLNNLSNKLNAVALSNGLLASHRGPQIQTLDAREEIKHYNSELNLVKRNPGLSDLQLR